MGDRGRRRPQGALDHGMHLGLRHWRDARRARLVAQQTIEAFLGEPLLPAPDHGPADADPPGDLQHRETVSREQDDPRPLDMLHGTTSILDDPLQPNAFVSRE